jgi:hypothetical protein
VGGRIPDGPTAMYFKRHNLSVNGTARLLGLDRNSIARFFRDQKFDQFCGRARRLAMAKILGTSVQQLAKDVKRVRAEHAARKGGHAGPPLRNL